MPDPRRAARQLLRDLQSAGLTHLPRPARIEAPHVSAPSDLPPPVRPPAVPSSGNPFEMPRKSLPAEKKPAVGRSSTPSTASLTQRQEQLRELAACVAECVRCPHLARTRQQTVFGVGNPQARVLFIGEAPGADEDRLGEPFVGRAGQLLTKIIEACGWKREEIYICNILRCRPPENRTPTEEEAGNCREYLEGQIAIVDPEFIVCWGTCAAQNLLGTKDPIGRMRQRFFQYGRARVLCTYHPSYLLRNPSAKKPVWEDMKLLLAEMGLEPPA